MKWDNAIGDAGFAILPSFFSHAYLDQVLQEINECRPPRSRAGIRHALSLSPVAAVAKHPQMLELACEVLGHAAFPFRATLFDKSPVANWLVVWHQDTALPVQERLELPGWGPWSIKTGILHAHAPAGALSQVLALRIHLDDSTSDNGPLRVLPRTHKLGVLNDDEIYALAVRTTPVECVAAKGGVVAMRPLVVHSSSKSRTQTPRRVLHIEYAADDSIAAPLHLNVT